MDSHRFDSGDDRMGSCGSGRGGRKAGVVCPAIAAIGYRLFILKSAYREFEDRLGQIKSPRGSKTQIIEAAINNFSGSFSLSQLEEACPGVSRDMIRRVLRNLKAAGTVECLGRGPGAAWRKKR